MGRPLLFDDLSLLGRVVVARVQLLETELPCLAYVVAACYRKPSAQVGATTLEVLCACGCVHLLTYLALWNYGGLAAQFGLSKTTMLDLKPYLKGFI